jgi:rod shape-determining protein MreC
VRYTTVGRPESQRRDLVIVAVLVVLAWVLSGLSLEHRLALTTAVRSTVLAPFLAAHRTFDRRGDLSARVARLQGERDALAQTALKSADLEVENRRLRDLIDVPERSPGDYLVAELVPAHPSVGDSHTFLVRAGSDRGVEAPVAVAVPEGLVGVVRSVSRGQSFGEFWSHPEFRVSVRAERGAGTGIVRALETETGETLMLLEGVPYQTVIPPGTLLVTAGLGGVYPPGIPVGTVRAEAESKSGWSRSYTVEPAVRAAEVSFVLVWQRPILVEDDAEAGREQPVPVDRSEGLEPR